MTDVLILIKIINGFSTGLLDVARRTYTEIVDDITGESRYEVSNVVFSQRTVEKFPQILRLVQRHFFRSLNRFIIYCPRWRRRTVASKSSRVYEQNSSTASASPFFLFCFLFVFCFFCFFVFFFFFWGGGSGGSIRIQIFQPNLFQSHLPLSKSYSHHLNS